MVAQDETNLQTAWEKLIEEHDLDAVACVTSALKRGIIDSQEANRYEKDADSLSGTSPAAASGTIDAEVLEKVEAAGVTSIVAGANHPFAASTPGDTSVEQGADARFAVVADIIASCGTAHAFACQSRSDFPLQPRIVFESIEATVAEALDEAVARAESAERGLLAAALGMARGSSSIFFAFPA